MKLLINSLEKKLKGLSLMALSVFTAVSAFAQMVTDTYTTEGNHTWTVPAGITSITVEAWGAGGGGGGTLSQLLPYSNPRAGGGGGGAYSQVQLTVAPGDVINLQVGFAGIGGNSNNDGTAGGASSADILGSTVISADGGQGGSFRTSNDVVGTATGLGGTSGIGFMFAGGNGGLELTSPNNLPLDENIHVRLNKAADVYVEYWKEGDGQVHQTVVSKSSLNHNFHLLTLEPNSSYKFRVVIDRAIPIKSSEQSFKTRPQSPWMIHDWIKADHPHDEKALGNGLVLLCYRGYPGYMAMVDGKGTIRWYWQDDKLGVRLASLTPRGTILALLAPASKDEFNKPNQPSKKSTNASYYLRSGRIGFVGGTVLVEIDLTGKEIARIDLDKKGIIMHHDVQMDKQNNIVGIVRDFRIDDRPGHPKDTDFYGFGCSSERTAQ